MQGPFSKELNLAMLRAVDARYFVTKESGKSGGFLEKVQAAEEAKADSHLLWRRKRKDHGSYGTCSSGGRKRDESTVCPFFEE